jgi:hypothetical protein
VKNGRRVSDPPGAAATQPERGYGWLAAVIPADLAASGLRIPRLHLCLRTGADLVGKASDVEIAPVRELRGDAAVSIAPLGRPARDGRPLPVRVVRRLANSGRVRLEARRARRAVSRRVHPTVAIVTWDHQRTLQRLPAARARARSDLADYFPQRALVVGRARPHESTLLDAVLTEARRAGGDDVVRTYCQRIGLKIDAKRLQAFAMAYWLDYVCDRLHPCPSARGATLARAEHLARARRGRLALVNLAGSRRSRALSANWPFR